MEKILIHLRAGNLPCSPRAEEQSQNTSSLIAISFFSATLTMLVFLLKHMYHDARHRESKGPPLWGPQMQDTYPFQHWTFDVMLWSTREDLPPARKAAWVATALRGPARALADTIPPQAILHGGQINGIQVDAIAPLAK